MKPFILYSIILLLSVNSVAQSKHDKIKALKVSFITERLNLTTEEAQQFWPLYNAYEETSSKIKHKELKYIRSEIKENSNTLSDTEANKLLEKLITAENKLHTEYDAYISKLRSVMSSKKIILLKIAEEEFKRKILEEYKRRGR